MSEIKARRNGKYIDISRNILEYQKQIGSSVFVLLCFLLHPEYNDLLIANELDMNLDEVIRSLVKLEQNGFIQYKKRFHGIIPRAISAETRAAIFARDNYCCARCGSDCELEIDHIIPVSKGGGSDAGNLQTLCKICNRKKAAKLEE